MKSILKTILKYYLKYITKLILLIHRPVIIAIAGSTNKTFVKEEIGRVLRELGKNVRANPKCFNTEIGLPLAVLSLPSGYNSYQNWLPIITRAPLAIFQKNFPEILILEFGVSDPGDIKYLLSIIKPKIAVITDITQRYLEGFADMDNLAGEYEYLLKSLDKNDLCVLNRDNTKIKNMAVTTKANVKFFGIQKNADYRAISIKKGNTGQSVKIAHNHITKECHIRGFGKHHIYALLAGKIIASYNFQ